MKKNKTKTQFINPEYLEMLKRKTLIESTGASLRLSGFDVSDERVEEIVGGDNKK